MTPASLSICHPSAMITATLHAGWGGHASPRVIADRVGGACAALRVHQAWPLHEGAPGRGLQRFGLRSPGVFKSISCGLRTLM